MAVCARGRQAGAGRTREAGPAPGAGPGVVFRVTSAELWLAGGPGQGHQESLPSLGAPAQPAAAGLGGREAGELPGGTERGLGGQLGLQDISVPIRVWPGLGSGRRTDVATLEPELRHRAGHTQGLGPSHPCGNPPGSPGHSLCLLPGLLSALRLPSAYRGATPSMSRVLTPDPDCPLLLLCPGNRRPVAGISAPPTDWFPCEAGPGARSHRKPRAGNSWAPA